MITQEDATTAIGDATKAPATKPATASTQVAKAANKAPAKPITKKPADSRRAVVKSSAAAPAKSVARSPAKKTSAKPTVKSTPKAPMKAVAKALPKAQVKAEKTAKEKKPKLVRDSFTIPKDEYVVLADLKQRAGKLSAQIKKGELLRAGIKALAAMSDAAFLAALKLVPTIKTGRPAKG